MEKLFEEGAKGSEIFAVLEKDIERFDGSMVKMSKTIPGLHSTFGDLTTAVSRQFAELFQLDHLWGGFMGVVNEKLTLAYKTLKFLTIASDALMSKVGIGNNNEERKIKERSQWMDEQNEMIQEHLEQKRRDARQKWMDEQNESLRNHLKQKQEQEKEEARLAEEARKREQERLKDYRTFTQNMVLIQQRWLNEQDRLRPHPARGFDFSTSRYAQHAGSSQTIVRPKPQGIDKLYTNLAELDRLERERLQQEQAALRTLESITGIADKVGQAMGEMTGAVISGIANLVMAFKTLETAAQKAWAAVTLGVSLAIGWITKWFNKNKQAKEEVKRHNAELKKLSRTMQGLPTQERLQDLRNMTTAYLRMTPAQQEAVRGNESFVQGLIDAVLAGEQLNPVLLSIIGNSELLGQTIGRLQDRLDYLEEEKALRRLDNQAKALTKTFDENIERINKMRKKAQDLYDETVKRITKEEKAAGERYDRDSERLQNRIEKEQDLHELVIEGLDDEEKKIRDLMRVDEERHNEKMKTQQESLRLAEEMERKITDIPGALKNYGLTGNQLGGGVLS